MSNIDLPEIPVSMKNIQHYLKIASEHDTRDPIISYWAGFLYDILTTFGELSEESSQNRKYAKWKAAYIHNCLKNGETPIPGPIGQNEGNDSTNYRPESDNEATSNNNNFDLPSVSNDQSPNTNPADSGSSNIPLDHNSQSTDDTSIADSSGFKSSGGKQNVSLNADQILKAQKYIKWAGSAINYDDISTAVENLQKALCLLTTGKDG